MPRRSEYDLQLYTRRRSGFQRFNRILLDLKIEYPLTFDVVTFTLALTVACLVILVMNAL